MKIRLPSKKVRKNVRKDVRKDPGTGEVVKEKPDKKRRSFFAKMLILFVWLAIFTAICALGVATAAYYAYRHFSRDLPEIASLNDYRPPAVTMVYADDGQKIGEFYKERRIVVPLKQMPEQLTQAFIAAEDARFYTHPGVDLRSIARAFLKNLEAGTVVQGGSTITQQVTKSFFLTPKRTYTRKFREAILAYRIDLKFSKEEILYLYLNQIYLGHGAYGVQAAAQNYFGKSVEELMLAECAMLAGLPQAPSDYSPFRHPEAAKERQIYTLRRMVENGFITAEEAAAAESEKLDIHPRRNWFIEKAPYYTEHVRRYVSEKYGEELLYNGGLSIYTAVDLEKQAIALEAVNEGLREHDRRHSRYRGPEKHLSDEKEIESAIEELKEERMRSPLKPEMVVRGVVTEVGGEEKSALVCMGDEYGTLLLEKIRWHEKEAREKGIRKGDIVLVRLKEKPEDAEKWPLSVEQTPEAESALICIEAGTGYVKAMIGGKDFKKTQFNRAVQSRRQPGSAFKPIIYAAAMDKGFTPATMIIDNAVVYEGKGAKGRAWKPKNYDRRFHGPILLRKALAKSRNLSTIKILSDIGVDYAVSYARKLGIESELFPDLSLALGASGVSLLELVRAFSVFANSGQSVEPIFITRILDRDGNILEESLSEARQVIDKSTAYIMTSLLESVVNEGTGRRVKALNRPVAGKTGTTNNLHDAWFMGYTPGYITGVWVGYDQERSLGSNETGSRAAIPIWLDFMQDILEGKPVRKFQVPEGVVFAKIDADSGLRAISESRHVIFEAFKAGTVPREYASSPSKVTDAGQFFKSDL